ncbi:MAG: hypothetical protein KKH98_06880 [Spirochaetes bacterium]|nr:hypothetical protein [Spirochaetota bacterium]
MKKLCIFIVIAFLMACSANKENKQANAVTEKDLISSWQTIQGGDAESIMFGDKDEGYAFSSYLHDRPFEAGTWKLENNKLILILDGADRTVVYNQIKLMDDNLLLIKEDGQVEKYKKIPDQD